MGFKIGYQCGEETPSVGIVNQWGAPAASSESTSSDGIRDLRF